MYAYVQDVPIGEELYARIMENLGPEPLEGLVVHIVLRRDDGKLRYVDVWESREACDAAFDRRIHPAVYGAFRAAGFKPTGEPSREPVVAVDVSFGTAAPRRDR